MRNVFVMVVSLILLAGCSSSSIDQPLERISSTATPATVPDTNEKSFQKDVLLSQTPVLVDFYATWCGPCKLMGPTVDDMASKYAGKVKVMRVDIDRNPTLTSRYNIEAVPTIAIFNRGDLVKRSLGVVSPEVLTGEINEVLQKTKTIGARTSRSTQL